MSESPLLWTTKSLSQLAKGLAGKGFRVGRTTVSRLLKQAGYRLQATFKTKEGAQHPDRDAQFGHINDTAAQFLAAGDPVVSMDAKKKELVGEYAARGREWQPSGQPVRVNGHDFPAGAPKAIPYGCMTSARTPGSCRWVSTTTPRRSRSTRCGPGGSRSVACVIPRRAG